MHQYWFINGNKYTIVLKAVTIGETGCRVYGNSLYYLDSFSVTLKLF